MAAAAHAPSRAAFLARIALFAAAGLAQAAAIAAPWNGRPLWWLQLLSLAVLVWQLDVLRTDPRPKRWRSAALHGWLFTTVWLCGAFWWLFVSMHTYGGMAAPIAATAVLALAAALALYYAVACGMFVALAPKHPVGAAVVFAALWTLGELLRGSWFTGFPWGAGGYAHVDGPLAVHAAWLGVYGIGAVAAAIAALAVLALRRRTWRGAAALIVVLVAAPYALDLLRDDPDAPSNARGRLGVALLQGNIPQDEKFIPGGGIATALRWYGEQLRDATAPLVITPETALPLLSSQLPPGYLEAIAARYGSGTQAAIVGLPVVGMGGASHDFAGYRNSVLGFKPGEAQAYRYDKHHLVPFGEFVPEGFHWFTAMMNIPLGDFNRGPMTAPSFDVDGERVAPNICYEDLFGEELAARFIPESGAPTILANLSNIGWFGRTIAIEQHLRISRMRSLELQRPMIRATNTGATVVIDHRGTVTHSLPPFSVGILEGSVEGRQGLTPFALWAGHLGLWPLALGALALLYWLRRPRDP